MSKPKDEDIMTEYKNSLWYKVGNKCLEHAQSLLDSETATTAATVEAVKGLVDVAIAIDMLNLRWSEKNQFGAAAFPGKLFSPQAKEN